VLWAVSISNKEKRLYLAGMAAQQNSEIFRCLNCGYENNADINASYNILNRFLTGAYGVRYKQDNLINFPSFSKFN